MRLEKSIFLKQISRLNGIKYFCNNTKLVLFLPLVPPKGPWRPSIQGSYSKRNVVLPRSHYEMAGFRPNSEIIGKVRKMEKFYGHFVQLEK